MNIPAYKGARFDADGFCLAHSDVRLCRLTQNGQYKIVRKTCYKCGSAALMTDPHAQKTNVHGYKKKGVSHREMPSELLTAKGAGGDDGHRQHAKQRERSCPRQRARTLSPRRRGRSKSTPRSSPKKPLSKSHVMQRMATETIRDLIQIKPPFSRASSKDGDGRAAKKDKGRKHSNSTKGRAEDEKEGRGQSEALRMCEGVGRCRVHPEVQLSITRITTGDGKWKIVKEICPHCFPSSTPHPRMSSGCGKQDDDSDHTHPVTPPSTPETVKATLVSDHYFSRALVIHKSPVAEKTVCKDNARSILRNSTARIEKTTKKRRSSSKPPKAYKAWDSLPVY
jgi:hypothetical protein